MARKLTAAQMRALTALAGDYSVHRILPDGDCDPGIPMAGGFNGLRQWDGAAFVLPAADAMAADVFKPGAILALPIPPTDRKAHP